VSNKEGLKTAMLLIDNRRADIKHDLSILNQASKLIGKEAITNKYVNLVDTLTELTALKGELVDLL